MKSMNCFPANAFIALFLCPCNCINRFIDVSMPLQKRHENPKFILKNNNAMKEQAKYKGFVVIHT